MKKIFTAIILAFAFAGSAMANGYCNRSGGAERERCYESGGRMESKQALEFFNKIQAAPNLSQADKDFLRNDQIRWGNQVANRCPTWECYYTNMRDRKNALIVWGTKKGVSFK